MRISQLTFIAISAAALSSPSNQTFAVDRTWLGPSGGIFGDPKNWTPGGVPFGADNALFDEAGLPEINFFADHTHNRLIVRQGATFNLNGYTYSLTAAAGSSIIVGDIADQPTTLSLNGGTLESLKSSIATATDSIAAVNVVFDSHWNNSGSLNIGVGGDGDLSVAAFSTVSSNGGVIGEFSTGSGFAFIQGGLCSWTNTGSLIVGQNGQGTLQVDMSANVTNSSFASIGQNPGSNGIAIVGNGASTWNIGGTLTVGNSGTGSLNIAVDGDVTTTTAFVGFGATGSGTINVNGVGSTLTCTGGMTIASAGDGDMYVLNGSGVSTALDSAIALAAGSDGLVVVAGADAKWVCGGDIHVGPGGTASLTVANGALVEADTVIIYEGDLLRGNATVDANLVNTNLGMVSPGLSPGLLTIDGNYTQTAGATLDIELGGTISATEYDVLSITGAASLNGHLEVTLFGGFVPDIGDDFLILTSASLSGGFATIDYPLLPPGRSFQIKYDPSSVGLRVVKTGDVNGDGVVNITDLLAVIAGWGACPTPPDPCPGDVDNDGDVDIADLLSVISNWGS
ncbi:MAG: dockerin type I domain-containing protein [Phycisphaerales bacterium]|nr:dockerin type I domain-containing protein [Phycisphaerales bacterium]